MSEQGDVIRITPDEYEPNKVYVTVATDEEPGVFMFPTRRWFAEMYQADHNAARQRELAVEALQREVEYLNAPYGMHSYDKNGFHNNDCLACGQRKRLRETLAAIDAIQPENASKGGE